MSDLTAFSLDDLSPQPVEDTQAKILNNALIRFCDEIEYDNFEVDSNKGVQTRNVLWRYADYWFKAKLITFDGQMSIAQYDFSTDKNEWQRLTTPRALAEKLTEAQQQKA